MRLAAILVGAAIGTLVGVICVAMYITVRYPNNYRDSGMPSFMIGCILGGPPGLVLGIILGAVWPLKNA